MSEVNYVWELLGTERYLCVSYGDDGQVCLNVKCLRECSMPGKQVVCVSGGIRTLIVHIL